MQTHNVIRDLGKNVSRLYSYKLLPYTFLLLIFFTLVTPLIIKPQIDIYDEMDERITHYRTVLMFVDQFPYLDLVHYRSATTPLYHVFLATSTVIFGFDLIQLRFINALISSLCLLMVYKYLSTQGDPLRSFYFTIIFMLSPYFVGPAIRLSTDNVALLLAFLAMYTTGTPLPNTRNLLLTNILILCTILVRQIYAWLIGAYFLFNLLKYKLKPQSINLGSIILPTLIPIAGLIFFIFLWKGLAPPHLETSKVQKLNWEVPVFIISLIGLYGTFFCFSLFKEFKKNRVTPFVISFLVGLSFGFLLLHPVSNEYPILDKSFGDRGGALWLLASKLPTFLSTSIVFWVLFPIGLVYLYTIIRHLAIRGEYLMMICFSLWLMGNMINAKTYQKYYEPFILFIIGYVIIALKTEEKWYYYVGPLGLLLGFIGVTLVRF